MHTSCADEFIIYKGLRNTRRPLLYMILVNTLRERPLKVSISMPSMFLSVFLSLRSIEFCLTVLSTRYLNIVAKIRLK